MLFESETEQGIFEQVLKGELDFVSEPWPSISDGAKDLVRRMLVRDPKKRLTAHEVLCKCALSYKSFWASIILIELYLLLHCFYAFTLSFTKWSGHGFLSFCHLVTGQATGMEWDRMGISGDTSFHQVPLTGFPYVVDFFWTPLLSSSYFHLQRKLAPPTPPSSLGCSPIGPPFTDNLMVLPYYSKQENGYIGVRKREYHGIIC